MTPLPNSDEKPGGPQSQFRSLYNAHYADISRFAVRRLRSPDDASDLVAEVFAIAWRRLDRVPAPPADRLWLYSVARRVLATQQRSNSRRMKLQSRLDAQPENHPEPSIGDSESIDHVLAALADLRANDRDALLLVLWEGLSHADAATVLGCSVNAVAIRVHRAKGRLRDALAGTQIESDSSQPIPVTPKRTRK